jgi:DNA sulfur modification protein DndC
VLKQPCLLAEIHSAAKVEVFMKARQSSLFEGVRLNLQNAIDLSVESLNEYGRRYTHWAIAYSGGKDSSAVVTFVIWAIKEGLVPQPTSLTVMYADTRQELPPLQASAMALLDTLRGMGIEVHVVLPPMDDRFYVYIFGRGVPPPKNKFRWCTPQLKIYPMQFSLEDKAASLGMGEVLPTTRNRYGRTYQGNGTGKLLMLTGVRIGESAARDQRIAVSCSKDDGECGQGWFQVATPEALADTLAPLLHWRLCHVYDWLYFENSRHGFDQVIGIADVYGDDEVRTGCVGCNLVNKDTALERLLMMHPEKWGHLRPLLELKPLFRELKNAGYRLRKSEPGERADGSYAKNGQRLGPLTMAAREYGLNIVLDIQRQVNDKADDLGLVGIDLINAEEEARIRELWVMGMWPNGWDGGEIVGDVPIDAIHVTLSGELVTQPLLI